MIYQEMIYAKANPDHIGLDHESGGEAFATMLRSRAGNDNGAAEIILDFSGNVRLDYWGCSTILNTCVDILNQTKNTGRKTLTVLTSLRYEDKENYAWLFFNKSRFEKEYEGRYSNYFELAVLVCSQLGFQFDLYKVPLRFSYESQKSELGVPHVVLSSK